MRRSREGDGGWVHVIQGGGQRGWVRVKIGDEAYHTKSQLK